MISTGSAGYNKTLVFWTEMFIKPPKIRYTYFELYKSKSWSYGFNLFDINNILLRFFWNRIVDKSSQKSIKVFFMKKSPKHAKLKLILHSFQNGVL